MDVRFVFATVPIVGLLINEKFKFALKEVMNVM